MSKKEVKEAAKAAEQHEVERRKAIDDFNRNNMGKLWIDPNKVPTEEDIEAAKKEFEEFTVALQEKKDYFIADKVNALRVAKFMQTFIDHTAWHGREFVGVLNFHALMDDFVKGFDEENPVDLVLEYGAMQFAFLMFKNYGGVGIESANWMAENYDEYLPIFEKLHELSDWYEFQVKKSENLKAKWGAMAQGYYLVVLEGADEDTLDPETAHFTGSDAPVTDEGEKHQENEEKVETEETNEVVQ